MFQAALLAASLLACSKAAEYAVYTGSYNWTRARQLCQAKGEHWDLASIHSKIENDALAALVVQAGASRVWIGGTDAASEGTFVWTDGTAFDYWNWAALGAGYQPDNAGGVEHFLEFLRPTGTKDWNDLPNRDGITNGYACGKVVGEIRASFVDAVLVFRMPVGYTYHRGQLWCESHGYGELASVHDATVHELIKRGMDDLEINRAWIGMSAVSDDGTNYHWEWEDGSAVNYDQFHYSNEFAEYNERVAFDVSAGYEWVALDRAEEVSGVICTGFSFAMHLDSAGGSWDTTNAYCGENYQRGQLATIHTDIRNEQLLYAFATSKAPAAYTNFLWIGMRDDADEGKWYWVDGSPTLFEDFSPGQPDDYNNDQDCAGLWWEGEWAPQNSQGYHWDDRYCGSSGGFVCGVPNGHANSIVTNNNRHRVSAFYGNFDEADDYCYETYGTRAASIENDDDNERIANAARALKLARVWIGYEATSPQVWEWTDQSGHTYENWGPDQPVAHEHAQMIAADGFWENVAGEHQYAGIVCNFAPRNVNLKADDRKTDSKSEEQAYSFTNSQLLAGGALSCIGVAVVYNLYKNKGGVRKQQKTETTYGAVL